MRLDPVRLMWLCAALVLFIASSAGAQVRRVHPDGNDSFTGTSWDDEGGGVGPWKTLRHALDELNTNGGFTEIWIATGEPGYAYRADVDPPIDDLLPCSSALDTGDDELLPLDVTNVDEENGSSNGADMSLVLGNWGTQAPQGNADCESMIVNGADLSVVLGNWGPCAGESMSLGGGGDPALEALMEVMGVESIEDLVEALLELDHETMATMLETLLS